MFFLVFWWSLGWFLGEFVYGKWLQDPSSQHQVAQRQKNQQQVAASAVFPEWEANALPHYKVLDPGWSSTQKVHGCFLPIPRGWEQRDKHGKTMKNHGFWSIFFDTKTNCRDIILCTFGAKSGPRVFRAFATHQKEAFRVQRHVHPQIASNSCAILWSFSLIFQRYSLYLMIVNVFKAS